MKKSNDVIEIDVKELFFAILHKLWIIMIVCILGGTVAGAASKYLIEPIYSSTTSVYVINRQEDNKMTLSDLQSGTQLTKDYMILVKSRPVMDQVIQELNMNLTQEALANCITVNSPEDTRILDITVNYPDAETAKLLADTIARVSSERMVSVMDMERVNVMEQGNIPTYPSSPDVTHNIMLGCLVGGILATFIIIVRHLQNDSIKTSEDIEKYLGITTLSSIPIEEGIDKRREKQNKSEVKKDKKKNALAS